MGPITALMPARLQITVPEVQVQTPCVGGGEGEGGGGTDQSQEPVSLSEYNVRYQ